MVESQVPAVSGVDGLVGNRRDSRYEFGNTLSAGLRQVLRWSITAVDLLDTVAHNALTLYFIISV